MAPTATSSQASPFESATETEIEPRGSSSDCCDASLGTVDARVGHCPGMLSTNQSARVNPRPLRMSACDDGSSMEMCKDFLVEFSDCSQVNDTGTARFFQPKRRSTGSRDSRRRSPP